LKNYIYLQNLKLVKKKIMHNLSKEQIKKVSGAQIVMSYTSETRNYHYDVPGVTFTLQFDGSIPPEFQAMIDSGASFYDMQPYLLIYQIVLANTRSAYPDLFAV